MPRRRHVLATGEFYHLFNRSVNKQPIFEGSKECGRALNTLNYYSFKNTPMRFSKLRDLSLEQRLRLFNSLKRQGRLVDIVAYCLMPNHFHLLAKQKIDKGISTFISNFQNSYARFFNTKFERTGPLWQGIFKSVRIEDDNQLLHVNRYIHLNPYTSFIVPSLKALVDYPWSSFREYLKNSHGFCAKKVVLSHFKRRQSYRNFIFDQADYQRELDKIKHLTLD